jgi:hypothetical protein
MTSADGASLPSEWSGPLGRTVGQAAGLTIATVVTRLLSWPGTDVWHEATVGPAVRGSDPVVNTVGHYVERERSNLRISRPRRGSGCRRCHGLIAADGLSANRRAVSRIELPRSTAPTMRSRRSMEMGAGMTTSR